MSKDDSRLTTLTRLPPSLNHSSNVHSTMQGSDDLSQKVGFFSLNHSFVNDGHGLGPCRPVCPGFCHNQQAVCDLHLVVRSPVYHFVHLLVCCHLHLVVYRPL